MVLDKGVRAGAAVGQLDYGRDGSQLEGRDKGEGKGRGCCRAAGLGAGWEPTGREGQGRGKGQGLLWGSWTEGGTGANWKGGSRAREGVGAGDAAEEVGKGRQGEGVDPWLSWREGEGDEEGE